MLHEVIYRPTLSGYYHVDSESCYTLHNPSRMMNDVRYHGNDPDAALGADENNGLRRARIVTRCALLSLGECGVHPSRARTVIYVIPRRFPSLNCYL